MDSNDVIVGAFDLNSYKLNTPIFLKTLNEPVDSCEFIILLASSSHFNKFSNILRGFFADEIVEKCTCKIHPCYTLIRKTLRRYAQKHTS